MIVITGAADFIGSNLAHRLASAGHDLLLVDHPLTAEKAANLGELSQSGSWSMSRSSPCSTGIARILEGVFHLGACSRTTETDWAYGYPDYPTLAERAEEKH